MAHFQIIGGRGGSAAYIRFFFFKLMGPPKVGVLGEVAFWLLDTYDIGCANSGPLDYRRCGASVPPPTWAARGVAGGGFGRCGFL